MATNLVPLCAASLCVIANAVKQSREKAYGKQLIWIASFLAMTQSVSKDSDSLICAHLGTCALNSHKQICVIDFVKFSISCNS